MKNLLVITSIICASNVLDGEEVYKNAHKDSKYIEIYHFTFRLRLELLNKFSATES